MKKLIALLLLFIGITVAARMMLPEVNNDQVVNPSDSATQGDISKPARSIPKIGESL